jgi:hypothetical protein
MGTRLLILLALLASSCDEEDPATSQFCVEKRMHVLELRYWSARAGEPGRAEREAHVARIIASNWQCFR